MNYVVTLRENATGVERAKEYPGAWDDNTESWWATGNFSCDCNRELEFRRAGGENPALEDTECGDTRYTLTAVLFAGRRFVPDESSR